MLVNDLGNTLLPAQDLHYCDLLLDKFGYDFNINYSVKLTNTHCYLSTKSNVVSKCFDKLKRTCDSRRLIILRAFIDNIGNN